MNAICSKCGSSQIEAKKFCADCGNPIAQVASYPVTSDGSKSNIKLAIGMIFISVIVGIGYGVYSFINSGVKAVTESFSPNAAPEIPEATGTVGTEVQDGQMTFLLNSAQKCFNNGGTKLCRFDVSVGNHSKTGTTFFSSAQKVADINGNLYDAASPFERDDYSVEFSIKELNPGTAVRGYVFFEVPKDAVLAKLIFHDSVFSSGVAVTIGSN